MKTNTTQLAAARRAIEAIAMREGISVEEVRREISLAILTAQPKDASIVSAIPCAGLVPTPEELIAYCVSGPMVLGQFGNISQRTVPVM